MLDSKLEIHAYAGPMEREEAEKFRKIWKTPPRTTKKMREYQNLAKLKFKDPQKGLECLGRVLASEREVGWKEYWPFLNAFVDITSKEGLELFEDYLKQRFNMIYGIDSSTSCVSSSSSSEQVEKCAPILPEVVSPITDLCNAFQLCTLNDINSTNVSFSIKTTNIVDCNDDKKTDILPETQILKNDISPFLYVEKTCQVFANRISNDILHTTETDGNLTNTIALELQMKQVMSVISSFKDDNRFNSVNFQMVHSRISTIVAEKLGETIKEVQNRQQICQILEKWLDLCGNNLDCFSSDDESINHRQQYVKTYKKSTSQNKQVACLLQCLLSTLNSDVEPVIASRVNNEEECIKLWNRAKPCSCILQSKHLKRNSLNKRHENVKYSVKGNVRLNGLDNVSRKLTFSEGNEMESVDSDFRQASNICNKVEETSSSDDEFYTPPSSPSLLFEDSESDSDDVFNDSRLPETEVFVEG